MMNSQLFFLTFGAIMVKLIELLLLTALLLCGCAEHHDIVDVTGQEDFREGDLVLRCGYGAESKVVTEASQSIYSHIGILHYDTPSAQWQVIHAVPGEAEKGEPELLKAESISEFYSFDRASPSSERLLCYCFMSFSNSASDLLSSSSGL